MESSGAKHKVRSVEPAMTQQRHHKLRWFRKVPQDSREVRIGSKTLEDLRVSEERFKEFFETWPEYCYMISPSGSILDVNTTACKALGYSKEELVGRHVSAIYAPESLSKMSDLFERWKWSGVLKDEELVVVTKQGQKRTVLLSARSVKDAKREPPAFHLGTGGHYRPQASRRGSA